MPQHHKEVKDLPSVSWDFAHKTCRIGKGNVCCRYLVGGMSGLECAKHSSLSDTLDRKVKANLMIARGDNCEGLTGKEEPNAR